MSTSESNISTNFLSILYEEEEKGEEEVEEEEEEEVVDDHFGYKGWYSGSFTMN